MGDDLKLLTTILAMYTPDQLAKALEAAGMDSGKLYPAQSKKLKGRAAHLPKEACKQFEQELVSAQTLPEAEAYAQAWKSVYDTFGEENLNKAVAESGITLLDSDGSDWALDRLYRSLLHDGYLVAATVVKSVMDGEQPELPATFFETLPVGYRDAVARRYIVAVKSAEPESQPEEQDELVVASLDDPEAFEIHTTFKALLPEAKVTYGVVYPNYDRTKGERDLQKEWATEPVIEAAAHKFMMEYRQQDAFHNEQPGYGVPVESFIAPCDITEFHGRTLEKPIRKGSWVMATKWTDEAWKLVKEGKITGYSIGGFKRIRRGGG